LSLVTRVAFITMAFLAVAFVQTAFSSRMPVTISLVAIAAGVSALHWTWRSGSLRRVGLAAVATVLLVLVPLLTLWDPRRQ
jgi:hypothetical protein